MKTNGFIEGFEKNTQNWQLLDFAVFEILGTGWFFDSECF
jgi:hypothetical protein